MKLVDEATLWRDDVAIKPETCYAMHVADQLHREKVGREAEFPYILNGTHIRGSLHYAGLAFDLRIWYLVDATAFAAQLRIRLGPKYDVVLKSDHIHIEFQPKHLAR